MIGTFYKNFEPQRVRQRLASLGDDPIVAHDRLTVDLSMELIPAAVLIPLTEIDGRMNAVFTQRPESMAEHSGEVSFPGGRAEKHDIGLRETALRETREEIALLEQDVHLYGALVQMPTITGYDVMTYVGEFEQPYQLRPDPREIDVLFTAPLDALADPGIHRMEKRSWGGMSFDLHFYEYGSFTIWGATGYMLHLLLEFLGEQ